MNNALIAAQVKGDTRSYVRARETAKRLRLLCLIAVAAALTGPTWAEKLDCSGTKRSKQEISSQSVKPGDRIDRELIQFVRVDVIASKNSEFDKTEMTVYSHMDNVGGTGIHRGYGEYTLAGGEKLWVKFEGTHHVIVKGDDDWEVPYLGVYHFISGTGKYNAIRGGGYYKGKATPNGLTEEFKCEAEY